LKKTINTGGTAAIGNSIYYDIYREPFYLSLEKNFSNIAKDGSDRIEENCFKKIESILENIENNQK